MARHGKQNTYSSRNGNYVPRATSNYSARNKTYSSRNTYAARRAHREGDRQFRSYDTSYIRPKRSKVPGIIAVIIIVVVIVAIICGIVFGLRGCSSTNLLSSDQSAQITVDNGEGALSIAQELQQAGLISNTTEFTERVEALGASTLIAPGTYTIKGGTSIDDIIYILEHPATTTFTVPEGYTISQTASVVETATGGKVTAADFIAAASNASVYAGSYSFLAEAGTNSLEGFLFPKTYTLADDATADSIIRTMLDQYQTEVATLSYTYAQEHGLSNYDVLKLASIVEKESDADHRATVASVFYNRLAEGMRLQSDATVAYYVGHDPTADDVATENPYNTYFIDGLTPTPINSPGLAALQAVCSPDETNYLYFYFAADDSGNMQYTFSETYEEHQAAYE